MSLDPSDLRELKSLLQGSSSLNIRITASKNIEALKWFTLNDFLGYITPNFTPIVPPDPGDDFPGAPPSVTAPSVGTSRIAQWNLQKPASTGPRHGFPNGKWNTTYPELPTYPGPGYGVYPQRPNDPYLKSLGYYYNNYGDLWIPFTWIDPGASRLVADYDFLGAPPIAFWGDGSGVMLADCANFYWQMGTDINRNPSTYTMTIQTMYCDYDVTTWAFLCYGTMEIGPYNRVARQKQALGFGGGYLVMGKVGINFHHNFATGGGCDSHNGTHLEWWQQILAMVGTGSYCYIEDNMIDFSRDGQSNPANTDGWTAVSSNGGDMSIRVRRNIVKGMDIVQWLGLHPPGGMGCFLGYGDDCVNSAEGVLVEDNCFSFNPAFPPTFKHGGGSLFPTQSGNRWFRDADSDTAGVPLVKADNVPLTLLDFG